MIPDVFQSHLWNTVPYYIYSLNISESFVLEPKCLSYFTIKDFKGYYPWYYISVVTKRRKIRNCVALNSTNILTVVLDTNTESKMWTYYNIATVALKTWVRV